MAKALKTLKFPGIAETYTVPVVDDTLSIEGAAADAKAVSEVLDGFMRAFLDRAHPVNSIYISYSHTDPATLFGGTWERINNAFLLACDENGEIGETGGEQTHTLTMNEMPSHSHYVAGNDTDANAPTFHGWFNTTHNTANTNAWYVHTSDTGGGQAHNNMPPYIQVAIWRRIA